MGVSDLFKRKNLKEKTSDDEIKEDVTQNIEIEIEGSIDLFKDEKEQIIRGS